MSTALPPRTPGPGADEHERVTPVNDSPGKRGPAQLRDIERQAGVRRPL